MSADIEIEAHGEIADIGQTAWDDCAASADYAANPFVSYTFLQALEESGCVGGRTGWFPRHLSVKDTGGRVAGVMPLYLKTHSQGEYVFDHSWAHAYERAGGDYYPKLQAAVPFTPATGPRLITREDAGRKRAEDALLAGALTVCQRLKASSLHVTFPTEGEWRRMGEAGLLLRQDQQY
ncbi:MAG: peptidogalycan biosysnthesis protein, partial [Caulobacteraceae bacterium]